VSLGYVTLRYFTIVIVDSNCLSFGFYSAHSTCRRMRAPSIMHSLSLTDDVFHTEEETDAIFGLERRHRLSDIWISLLLIVVKLVRNSSARFLFAFAVQTVLRMILSKLHPFFIIRIFPISYVIIGFERIVLLDFIHRLVSQKIEE
jgi:hypothetical protein